MLHNDTATPTIGIDILVIATLAVASPVVGMYLEGSILRFVYGSLLLFVAPGYLAMIALFPEATPTDEQSTTFGLSAEGIGPTERLALAVGLSVALIPMFAFGLWIVGVGATGYDFVYVAVFVLGLVVLAVIRRALTPPDRRYVPQLARPLRHGLRSVRQWPSANQFLVVVLALTVLAAFAMLTVAIAAPQDGEQFTELHVGTVDANGEFVLGGYPDTLEPGSTTSFTVKVVNHEGAHQSYQVTAELQALDDGRLVASEELDRTSLELDDGEATTVDLGVEPSMTGSDLKLVFTLQPEHDVDGDDEQTVYLWVDVTDQ